MKCELTDSNGASRLILIFAGWSTTPAFYSGISVKGYDVMVAYDYSDLTFPEDVLAPYSTVCLFAWSLGVFAASVSFPFNKAAIRVAVNGTENPVNDREGIPLSIFNGTEASLNERNLMKFRRRMAGNSYNGIADRFAAADIDGLRNELRNISRLSGQISPKGEWDRAYISADDSIFSSTNQLNFWRTHHPETDIREIGGPHYVNLSEIICGIIPERETVGTKFQKALPSYHSYAEAQRTIAERLLSMIPATSYRKVLEIGPGSGLLTEGFAKRFSPEEMDFIDLYPLPHFEAAPTERYHTEDAEDWMDREAGHLKFDAIISSSSIQWFVNPEKFFHNAARMLNPGGVLACSTFGRNNLLELHDINPFGLIYRNVSRLQDIISPLFEEIIIEEATVGIDFPSSRELMIHLRKTGVGGGSRSQLPLSQMLKSLPCHLTYNPIYIIGIKTDKSQG